MFASINRLPSTETRGVLRTGNHLSLPELQLVYRKKINPHSRFTVVVSLKIDKRAVVRNRLKRLVRESVRHLLPTLRYTIDGVVIVRKNFSKSTQVEIQEKIRSLFEKI